MVLPLTGTVAVTNGLDEFTWTGTPLTPLNCVAGAAIVVNGLGYFVKERTDTTQGKFTRVYGEATDASRPAEIEQISPDQVATATLNKRASDLFAELSILTPNWDAQVADLASRAEYDDEWMSESGRPFAVLVSNIGDGRAAIYSKVSATSADWSDPAFFSGPVGPLPDVEVGSTTTLEPGSPATVAATPTAGGVSLSFGLPAGRGAKYAPGGYDPEAAYPLDQAVLDNGSTWIALQAVPPGNAPPVLPITSSAYWGLLARKGTDGTGTGDVVGPAASVANRIALFDGTTGKLLKDSGSSIADLSPEGLSGFRNKIINGNFDIWQRGTSTASGGYLADRWSAADTNQDRAAFAPGHDVPGEPEFYGSYEGHASGIPRIIQKIEGVRTLAGKKATLTFYAKTDTGTADFTRRLSQIFGSGGSADVVLSLAGTLTTAWQKFTMVVDLPSLAGKTIGANNVLELKVEWALNQSLHIAHVSLVEGDATAEADPFSPRHIQQELALCQRYYRLVRTGVSTMAAAANELYGDTIQIDPPMRVTPTISFKTALQNVNVFSYTRDLITAEGYRAYITSTAAGFASLHTIDQLDAEL
ncbi:MAG TPA: hypothetical protein VGN60_09200 [Devosia sp.]|jgi:hypothetical protein|nr:hypothetical protein [Devosia sp.]